MADNDDDNVPPDEPKPDKDTEPKTPEPVAAGDTPAPEGGDVPASKPNPYAGWTSEAMQKQMDRERKRRQELEDRLVAAQADAQQARQLAEATARRTGMESPPAPLATPPTPPPIIDDAIIEQRVQAKLVERDIKAIEATIRRDYSNEWSEAFQNYQRILGTSSTDLEEMAIRDSVMKAILSTDDAAYTLIEIGKNPTKLQELVAEPEGRRNKLIYDIGNTKPKSGAAPPKPPLQRPSSAPPPPVPPPPGGGGPPLGSVDLYDPRLEFNPSVANDPALDAQTNKAADDAWFAERQRQKRESTGRPWSVGGKAGGPR